MLQQPQQPRACLQSRTRDGHVGHQQTARACTRGRCTWRALPAITSCHAAPAATSVHGGYVSHCAPEPAAAGGARCAGSSRKRSRSGWQRAMNFRERWGGWCGRMGPPMDRSSKQYRSGSGWEGGEVCMCVSWCVSGGDGQGAYGRRAGGHHAGPSQLHKTATAQLQ